MYADFKLIEDVKPEERGCLIYLDDGTCTGLGYPGSGDVMPFLPVKGDHCRLYGNRFGTVRGIFINGVKFRYYTESQAIKNQEEMREKSEGEKEAWWEENKIAIFNRIDKLPNCFQLRIKRFMDANSKFGPNYLQYELNVCEQAALVSKSFLIPAYNINGQKGLNNAYNEAVNMPMDKFCEHVTGFDNGHSGNSFGILMRLAYYYSCGREDSVIHEHGALATLVGCEKYGCLHKSYGSKGSSWPFNDVPPDIRIVPRTGVSLDGSTHHIYYKEGELNKISDFYKVISDILYRDDHESGAKLVDLYVKACPKLGYKLVRENLLFLYSYYEMGKFVDINKYVELLSLYPEAEEIVDTHENQAIGEAIYISDLNSV